MPDYFNVGAFRDKPSWHGKEISSGGVFTGETTIWEQMQRSGMDFEIEVVPSYYPWNGEFVEIPGKYNLIVPHTKWNSGQSAIRHIGNRYSVLQNFRIAELLEPLNKIYPLESLAILKDGKIVFVELRMQPFEVGKNPNEVHNSFLAFGNDHTMNSAYMGLTSIRLQCSNTWNSALGQLTSIPHSTDVEAEVEFRAVVMKNSFEGRRNTQTLLDKMFSTPIKQDEFANVVEAAFPNPDKPRSVKVFNSVDALGLDMGNEIIATMAERAESGMSVYNRAVERQNELRMDVGSAFTQFNDEQPYCGGTVYAAWNAVTQVVNHSPKFYGGNEKGMVSLFFGQKKTMLDAAYKTCVELIK